ncbi:MAG TPA: ABC transporter ATP-binding protein [Candidatus Tectomicrobia bacterium]|nr:ABC transporter ATP-binding protein [Candidatus Tectomicrobia bacterium]
MSAVVELEGACKRYGDVDALAGVSLAIARGEVVAILGPNGAGKTTAISLMLGLRRPTAGRVRLFGLDPADRRARSRCGAMLQESGVPPVLSVRELVDLFRAYYPEPLPADRVIALAGLEDRARTRAGALSTGQRQRLYFALALCGDPEVLFLDEPTVGMDVAARRTFLAAIGRLAAEGRTIVLTTHYLEEADALAGRIVVIDRGVVIADASPREIKARIPSKRVEFQAPAALDPSALDGLPVSAIERPGGRVRLLTADPEAVLRALLARGVPLDDLEVAGADLEAAFLALTAREARR